jgi:abnormal spindle-like microcephaly-associated protein
MYRHTAGTPCPAPAASLSSTRYYDYAHPSSVYAPSYAPDDTTANIDFTRELQTKPSHAKPRRPMRAVRQAAFNPSLDIFQDVAQAEEHEMKRTSRASVVSAASRPTKSTILAHPAHKIPAHKLPRAASSVQDAEPQRPKVQRRRVSQVLRDRESPNVNATLQLQEESLQKKELRKQGPKKDPRRRTIYVPSDDTTMITIHPGQSTSQPRKARETSPNVGLDLVTLSEEDDASLVSALKRERGVSRKSLAVPPKRGPLTSSARSLQSVSFSSDIMGSGDGKENVPPGMEVKAKKMTGTHIEINFPKAETKKPAPKTLKADSHVSKRSDVPKRTEISRRSDIASQTRIKQEGSAKRLREQLSYERIPVKSIKARSDITASAAATAAASARAAHKAAIKNAKPKVSRVRPAQLSSSPFHTDRTPPAALRRQRAERTSGKITMMHIVGKPQHEKQEKYPVLEEDLARPELYEENWLTYQEVAITQLVNSMFDSAHKNPNAEESPEDLRKKMLAIYHDPSMPPLHKRLQASLQFGALSIPKDLLAQTLRLKDDVGLRKKFLNLWTKSYDLNALRAAAETIVGRQINTPSRLSTGSTMSDDGSRVFRAERRAIEHFLDAFLIKNEDAVRIKSGVGSIASIARGEDDFGSQGWSWRRTVLRSLMLVLVLDQAKATDVLPGCLFQSTSPYKTSVDILHQLSTMLLPSHGDITRPLGHLTYKVAHVQYPLQEYTYHIDNIAIDLRDGIVLTRLVELLLYSAATLVEQQEDTVTISMPSGEVLTSSFDFSQKESWVLSQHLKFPAIGRPQKMYNVQIALAALSGVRGLPGQAAGGVKAEEIVDGHREKTLSLLWSLVGKCGLGSLVDWSQIVKETERFRDQWYSNRDSHEEHDLDSDSDEETAELNGLNYHKRLLLSWARSIARLHGFRIANLTTSFADSKVLEVIVDTYLPPTLTSPLSTTTTSLAAKLSAVGCSTSFIALFMPQHTSARSIPSRDFTLLTLSFLASRLLPLSLTHRAASTIQRAYRAHLTRLTTRKRIAALKTAHECAAVAQARQRLVDAATSIQRRWRAVLLQRRHDLEADVVAFQALARAWAIRRWVRRITAGRIGGKEKSRRVRGGW